MTRDRWQAVQDKRKEVKAAEAAGEVVDSIEVRKALLARVTAGEITLEEAKAELARLKRGAKKAGKITRSQAWRRG